MKFTKTHSPDTFRELGSLMAQMGEQLEYLNPTVGRLLMDVAEDFRKSFIELHPTERCEIDDLLDENMERIIKLEKAEQDASA